MSLRDRLINLVDLICYVCDKRLGSGPTLCYDVKTDTGRGWRHCDCPAPSKSTK